VHARTAGVARREGPSHRGGPMMGRPVHRCQRPPAAAQERRSTRGVAETVSPDISCFTRPVDGASAGRMRQDLGSHSARSAWMASARAVRSAGSSAAAIAVTSTLPSTIAGRTGCQIGRESSTTSRITSPAGTANRKAGARERDGERFSQHPADERARPGAERETYRELVRSHRRVIGDDAEAADGCQQEGQALYAWCQGGGVASLRRRPADRWRADGA
jgi:hypothetical protein